MTDRTLIVPGTQATTLRDQNGTTVYNAVRVSLGLDGDELAGRPPERWAELLGTEHAPGAWGPTRTSLDPAVTITPGPAVGTPYDRLPKPNSFFPYDWRLDSRYNAQRLIDVLRAEKPSGGRWNLIGHSQGGLIIVLASMLTTDLEEFGRLVARVVLVGCPLAGTQRALEAITVGRRDFGGDLTRVLAARAMAQTWPALYQMLPAWDSVVDSNGDAVASERQFTSPGGFPGAWAQGIDTNLLQRARETQSLLEGPLSRFGPEVSALVIQGEKQPTPTRIMRSGTTLATTNDIVGDRFALDFQQTKGDTLVPSEVTLEWGGKGVRERTLRIAGPVKEHAFLCDGKFVVKKIARFLTTTGTVAALSLGLFGLDSLELDSLGLESLGLGPLGLGPVAVEAQQYRVQAGGSGGFSDGHLLFGVDLGTDIGGGDCEVGGPVCAVPRWTWLFGAYGGLITEPFPLTAFGHVGVERKLSDRFSLGALGFAFAYPPQWGIAGRLDALDVGALKVGHGWGDRGGFLLSVEVAWEFLRDLGR
jgi:pimeloyl-ACP methyl ester carboxylesterase